MHNSRYSAVWIDRRIPLGFYLAGNQIQGHIVIREASRVLALQLDNLSLKRIKDIPKLLGNDSQLVWIDGCKTVDIETRLWSFLGRWASHFSGISGVLRRVKIQKIKVSLGENKTILKETTIYVLYVESNATLACLSLICNSSKKWR